MVNDVAIEETMAKSVSKRQGGARLLATDAKDHHANAFCMFT